MRSLVRIQYAPLLLSEPDETIRFQLKNYKSIPPIEPSCKKTMYNSKAEAEDMIRYIREKRVVRELRAYQCTICGKWHLTSKSE
jgi:hypothetical protein